MNLNWLKLENKFEHFPSRFSRPTWIFLTHTKFFSGMLKIKMQCTKKHWSTFQIKGTVVFIRITGSTMKNLHFCLHMKWSLYSYLWSSFWLSPLLMVLRNKFEHVLACYSHQPSFSRLSKRHCGVPVSLLDATTAPLRASHFKMAVRENCCVPNPPNPFF